MTSNKKMIAQMMLPRMIIKIILLDLIQMITNLNQKMLFKLSKWKSKGSVMRPKLQIIKFTIQYNRVKSNNNNSSYCYNNSNSSNNSNNNSNSYCYSNSNSNR